jgi:hypothetical protein
MKVDLKVKVKIANIEQLSRSMEAVNQADGYLTSSKKLT